MKSRKGFVSNSSSSSFILIKEGGEFTKNNLSEKIKEFKKILGYSNPNNNELDDYELNIFSLVIKEFEEGKTYSIDRISVDNDADMSDINEIVKFFNGKIIWEDY